MKQQKISLLIIVLIISSACFSQRASRNYMGHVNRAIKQSEKVEQNKDSRAVLLNESFENDEWPPEGWTTYELGSMGIWEHRLDFGNTGEYCAYHQDVTGDINSWLVSPQLLIDDSDYLLTFYEFTSLWETNTCNVLISIGSPNPADGEYTQVFTAQGAGWFESQLIDLSMYDGQNVYIGFQVLTLSQPQSAQWFIDDISVAPSSFTDGAISIESPVGYSPGTGTEDIVVMIENFGTVNITSFEVEWWINGEQQTTYTGSGTIFPGYPETKTIGQYDFDEEANYTIETKIVVVDDEDPSNDNASALYSVGLSNDLTILGISPYGNSPNTGLRNIDLELKNNGTLHIFDLDVEWSVNAVAQPVYAATGLNIQPGETYNLNIGQFDFVEGLYEIEVNIPVEYDLNPDDNEFVDIYSVGGLFEDFQGNYPPDHWQINYSLKSTFRPQGSDPNNTYVESWGGTTSFGVATDTTYTPMLDITAGDELTFMAMTPGYSIPIVWKNGLTGEINVLPDTIYPSYIQWEEFTVDLTVAAGHNYIGFVNSGDGGFTVVNFDDVYSTAPIFTFDNDLMVLDWNENVILKANIEETIICTIKNIGDLEISGSEYSVKLMDVQNGELVSLQGTSIGSFDKRIFELPYTFSNVGNYELYIEIDYADDEMLDNNVSDLLDRSVVPENTEFPTIGSPDYPGLEFPFNLTAVQGYPYGPEDFSQVMYYSDEIGTPGMIYGIKYYYTNIAAYGGTAPLKLWIAETELNEFEGEEWYPQEEFQMVFDGSVTTTGDDGYIYLPFDEPYLYDGTKNIIVQNYCYDTASYIFAVSYISATLSVENVRVNTLWDRYGFDLENLPTSFATRTDYPYTTFTIDPMEDLGIISGIIYDENNNPVNNAEVSVENSIVVVTSGADGFYSIPPLGYGEYTIQVEKFGYDYNYQTVNLDGTELTQDFYLELRPQIQLTGNVTGSNDLSIPLEGVEVSLEGYYSYSAFSNSQGEFTLNNVYGNETYQMTLQLYGYETIIDTIELTDVHIDLGEYVMQEDFIPAVNVIAEGNDNNASLEWINPTQSQKNTIIYDLGYDLGGFANEPNETVWLGNKFENSGTITLTDADIFFTFDEGGVEDLVSVDIFNEAGEIIATSARFNTPWNDWVYLDLPNLTITGDYYIMVHWELNELTTNFLCYDWDFDQVMTNAAYIKYPDEDLISMSEYFQEWPTFAFWIRAKVLEESSNKETKEVLSYNVYRGLSDDISNVSQWNMINSDPVTETSFTDDTWPPVGVDNYIWAIEAIYAETDAEVTFSNIVFGGTYVSISENQSGINIYPNPFSDNINIKTEAQINSITVLSLAGIELIKESVVATKSITVDLKNLVPGIYYLKIETNNGLIHKKIIKN